MKTDQEVRDGMSAKMLIDNPLFKASFDAIEKNLIDSMRRVHMADMTTQHELILSLQVLNNVKRHFESMIQTGRMAEIQKETLAQKVKTRLRV